MSVLDYIEKACHKINPFKHLVSNNTFDYISCSTWKSYLSYLYTRNPTRVCSLLNSIPVRIRKLNKHNPRKDPLGIIGQIYFETGILIDLLICVILFEYFDSKQTSYKHSTRTVSSFKQQNMFSINFSEQTYEKYVRILQTFHKAQSQSIKFRSQ